MAYAFIDESGDLGFSRRSSGWFIVTAVIAEDEKILEHIVKKVRKSLTRKGKKSRELHAYHATESIRKKLLLIVAENTELRVVCVAVEKQNMQSDQKNNIYAHVTGVLLKRVFLIDRVKEDRSMKIFIDKKDTNKNLRLSLEKYLLTVLKDFGYELTTITFKDSHEKKALQVIDFISWSIFRKYEQCDKQYYEIIKGLIIEEYMLSSKSKKASRFTETP